MHPSVNPSRWPLRVALTVVALVSVGLFGTSFVEYEFLKSTADRFSGSGDAAFVTQDYHASLVARLRLSAALLLAATIPLYALRRRLNAFPARWGRSNRAFAAATRAHLAGLRREPKTVLVTALLLIALGVLVRLAYLGQPLRFDEGRTFLSFAQMPFHYIPLRYNEPNNHILNTLLMKVSTSLFGEAEWAIRLPAFTWGVLMLPAAFLAFRVLIGSGAALVALGLIATSSPLVEFSTNGRGYTLLMLVFMGMILAGHYAWRERSLAAWTAVALLGTIGAFCIPIMALPAGSVFVWLLLCIVLDREGREKLPRVRDLIGAGLAMSAMTALLYAPVMAVNGVGKLVSNEGVKSEPLSHLVTAAPIFLDDLMSKWHRDYPLPIVVLLAAGAAIGLLFHARIARVRAPLHAGVAVIVAAYLVGVSDFGWLRVWLFVVPVYLAVAGTGILAAAGWGAARLGRAPATGALGAALALALAVPSAVYVVQRESILADPETGVFPSAELAIETIEPELRPGDLLSMYGTNATQLEYYARRRGIPLEPRGDYENARWFEIGGDADGTGRGDEGRHAFIAVNRAEVYCLYEAPYMLDRPPPGVRLSAELERLYGSEKLDVFRVPFAAEAPAR